MLGICLFENLSIDLWQGPIDDFYCDLLVNNKDTFQAAYCTDPSWRHLGYEPPAAQGPEGFFADLYQVLSREKQANDCSWKKRRLTILLSPSQDYFLWKDCHLLAPQSSK